MDREYLIKNQIEKLPGEIKNFLLTSKWIEKTQGIAQNFSLTEDQSSKLEDEVLLVIIELDLEENFVENLKANLDLSQNVAASIAEHINADIFSSLDTLTPSSPENSGGVVVELEQPHNLIGSTATNATLESPIHDLSDGGGEERISLDIGSPAEKAVWEERKEKVTGTTMAGNTYGGVDPYREPLN